MGANCSNCNCNRDEREHEFKIDEKQAEGRGLKQETGYYNDNTNNI